MESAGFPRVLVVLTVVLTVLFARVGGTLGVQVVVDDGCVGYKCRERAEGVLGTGGARVGNGSGVNWEHRGGVLGTWPTCTAHPGVESGTAATQNWVSQ